MHTANWANFRAILIATLVLAGVTAKADRRAVDLDKVIRNSYDIVYSECGTARKSEFLLSLKSLQLMALSSPASEDTLYRVHIITDGGLTKEDLQVLEPSSVFVFILHSPNPIAAPLFAPCSTQRLYLHEHPDFTGINDVVYLDVDTLWIDSMANVAQEFAKMREKNALFGMATETTALNGNGSWYKGGYSRSLPYYGEFGLNAGVLLLSLDRIRMTEFSRDRDEIITFYYPKRALPLGDQDVLNAYAHKHEEHIHVMSCSFNFRSDTACYDGFPVILHGNRQLRENTTSSYSSLYRMFARVHLEHSQ